MLRASWSFPSLFNHSTHETKAGVKHVKKKKEQGVRGGILLNESKIPVRSYKNLNDKNTYKKNILSSIWK